MTAQEAQHKINEVISLITPIVAKIEARPATTKNHYGDYLAILGMAGVNERKSLAAVLVKAGANFEGVQAALNLSL